MTVNKIFQKRFLMYALGLHCCVGLSFALFDNEDNDENKEKDEKRIIEIDISAPSPKKEDVVMAETFTEDDFPLELEDLSTLTEGLDSSKKLKRAEMEEIQKAKDAAKVHERKRKEKLAKEKKRLQKEKLEKEKKEKKLAEAKKKKALEDKKKEEQRKIEEQKKQEELKAAEVRKKKQKEKEAAEKKERGLQAKKRNEAKSKELANKRWIDSSDGQSAIYEYSNALYSKVKGKWIRPHEAKTGWTCELEVIQNENGQIKYVRKVKCDPNNERFYQSVYKAVISSSPLPLPKDQRIFDKKIKISFAVD